MVFITLGTQGNQFPRCLKMVEELIDTLHPDHEFIAQVGDTKYESNKIQILQFVPEQTFTEYVSKADIIITHAGSGALFSAISHGKKAIAVARLQKYNEMGNDHQTELVRKLTDGGYILDGTYSIIEAWKKLPDFNPRGNDFKCGIVEDIKATLSKWGIKEK